VSNKEKQKRIRKILDAGQCPCPFCSSQDELPDGEAEGIVEG